MTLSAILNIFDLLGLSAVDLRVDVSALKCSKGAGLILPGIQGSDKRPCVIDLEGAGGGRRGQVAACAASLRRIGSDCTHRGGDAARQEVRRISISNAISLQISWTN